MQGSLSWKLPLPQSFDAVATRVTKQAVAEGSSATVVLAR
jgi:hypothetical protein